MERHYAVGRRWQYARRQTRVLRARREARDSVIAGALGALIGWQYVSVGVAVDALIGAGSFAVVGLIVSPMIELGRNYLRAPLGMAEDRITELEAQLRTGDVSGQGAQQLAAALKRLPAELEAIDDDLGYVLGDLGMWHVNSRPLRTPIWDEYDGLLAEKSITHDLFSGLYGIVSAAYRSVAKLRRAAAGAQLVIVSDDSPFANEDELPVTPYVRRPEVEQTRARVQEARRALEAVEDALG